MKLHDKLHFKFNRKYYNYKIRKYTHQEPATPEAFEKVMALYANEICFIHGGYRAIRNFFDPVGGLTRLINILDTNYKITVSPSYTLTFKKHGVFHLKFSKPDIGWFGNQFEKFADFRSHDPLGSMWIRGDVDPASLDLVHSFFAENGLNGYVDTPKANTLCLGTDTIMLSHLHYLEQKFKLPYRKDVVYKGVVYYDETNFEHVEHTTTENKYVLQLERERVEYDLLKEGVLHRHDFGDLVLRVMNNEAYGNFIYEKTKKDPYYLFYESY